MGSCRNKKLIGPLLDGQLGDCRWLEEHINGCPECLAEYEAIQKIGHLTSKSDFAPPEGTYWRGFVTRVSARIAVCKVPRKRLNIFGSRLAAGLILRIGAPLALALLFVVIWQLKKSPPEEAQSQTQVSLKADNASASEMAEIRNVVPEKIQRSNPANLSPSPVDKPSAKSALARETAPEPDAVTSAEASESNNQASLHTSDALNSNAYRRLASLSRQTGYRPGELSITDLTSGTELIDPGLLSFDTKQILKFQMFAGSNSSLAPISMYHKAAGKFFAPVRSNSRVTFSSDTEGKWGYGFGDDGIDGERLYHLKLELYLLHDK